MTLNLKQKSFLFVALNVVILLIAYTAFSRFYLEGLANTVRTDQTDRVETAARTLDDFFQRGIDKLNKVATLPGLIYQLPSPDDAGPPKSLPASSTLHYLVYESDVFTDGVVLVNPHGNVLWLDPPENNQLGTAYPAFNLVRDSFKSEPASNTSFVIWNPPDKKQPEILLSTPMNDRSGVVVGYLIGAIPTNHETIERALGTPAPETPLEMQLVADDGTVVAGNSADRFMRQLPYRELALTQSKGRAGGSFNWPTGSSQSLVSFKNLTNAAWFVSNDEDESTAMTEVNRFRKTLILFGALIAIVSMGTLIFVVRSFTRPVEVLTAEAQRIAAGDMTVRFTSGRKDEIGVLAASLEDMKMRLNASYERLLQSEKMALMGQVVAGIAHELNNPLTIVIGHAELMMLKGVSDQDRAALHRIHDGAERAAKIVRNLLTFARQKKPERKLTDINAVINKTVDLRQYELKVSNIELQLDLQPTLPSTMCDPHQLQQVFLNLIVNAEHAMIDANGHGRLIIRTHAHERTIRILFEDNGPGISTENMRRLFDPFFTTKPVGKGTGLGLSICQGIMAEHSGQIKVESTSGFGATFTVVLPVLNADSEEEASAAVFALRAATATRKVLVIDDEGPMRELFGEILRQEGHSAIAVNNGRDALRSIDEERFDLIISDVKMPDTDGPAFYQMLKERKSPLVSKILFVTGDLMNPATLRFLETSGNPWIAKPFEIKTVRETVRKMLL